MNALEELVAQIYRKIDEAETSGGTAFQDARLLLNQVVPTAEKMNEARAENLIRLVAQIGARHAEVFGD